MQMEVYFLELSDGSLGARSRRAARLPSCVLPLAADASSWPMLRGWGCFFLADVAGLKLNGKKRRSSMAGSGGSEGAAATRTAGRSGSNHSTLRFEGF